jgi:hypothetical protein
MTDAGPRLRVEKQRISDPSNATCAIPADMVAQNMLEESETSSLRYQIWRLWSLNIKRTLMLKFSKSRKAEFEREITIASMVFVNIPFVIIVILPAT